MRAMVSFFVPELEEEGEESEDLEQPERKKEIIKQQRIEKTEMGQDFTRRKQKLLKPLSFGPGPPSAR